MADLYEKHIIAYAKDPLIRFQASSGGFCKVFLQYLIEQNIVDKVIFTRMEENGSNPMSLISNDVDKILTRTNSIYQYHNQIKILDSINEEERYVFIGLPCFVRYIRTQQIKYNRYKNIQLLISILCNQAPSPSFKESICKDNNIDIPQISEIDYRHGVYPGKIKFSLKDNSSIILSFKETWVKYNYPNLQFIPMCCLNCELFESTFADIVVGDPWLTDYDKSKLGWTKVIVRNKESMNLIEQSKKYIYFEELKNTVLAYKHTKQDKYKKYYA